MVSPPRGCVQIGDASALAPLNPSLRFADEQTAVKAVKDFVAVVFGPDDVVEVRRIQEGADHAQSDWYRAEDWPEAVVSLRALNAAGWHIYVGANPRPAEGVKGDASIALARCLFADFDAGMTAEEANERITEAGMPGPTMTISTGGGVHVYWRLHEPLDDMAEFRLIQRRIIAALRSDNKIQNPERIMRSPGFLNCKAKYGEPRPVKIVDSDPGRRYSLAEVVGGLPELAPRPAPTARTYTTRSAGSPGGVERCKAWLRKAPDSIEGSNGSEPMFEAACETVRFDLSQDEAWEIMDWFNVQKCVPAWTDKQIQHKLADAANVAGHERGCRNQSRFSAADFDDVDITGIVGEKPAAQAAEGAIETPLEPAADPVPENAEPAAEPAQAADAAEEEDDDDFVDESFQFAASLDLDCYTPPGIIGDFVRHNLATALYPQPVAAFAAGVALVATVTGRKVTDRNRTRTNGFFVVTGKSRSGKDSPRQLNKELLHRAGGEKMIGGEGIQSAPAIVTALEAGGGVSLFQLDEFGRVLDACRMGALAGGCMGQIPSMLMRLYGSSHGLWKGDSYAAEDRNKTIMCPHAVLLGTSTATRFWESLTVDNVTEGLMGRFIVFESGDYVDYQPDRWAPAPESLVAAVREWVKYSPGGGNLDHEAAVVEKSPAATERFNDHVHAINAKRVKESPVAAAIWSGSGEKVGKLALSFACSRCKPGEAVIELADVDLAIKLMNHQTRRTLHHCRLYVGHNAEEQTKKRVLREIGFGKEWTATEINRVTQWLDSRKRREVLEDLVDAGKLRIGSRKTSRQAVKTYFRPQRKSQPFSQ